MPLEWFGVLQNWVLPFDSTIVNIRLPEQERLMSIIVNIFQQLNFLFII